MRTTRFVTTLVASGLLLLVAAIALSLMNAAAAAPGGPTYDTSAYHYTERPSAAAATSRVVAVYVDTDFGPAERERIGFALQQWNHVLNGFVRLHPVLLDSADRDLGRLRRPGWIVAKVDSRHPLGDGGCRPLPRSTLVAEAAPSRDRHCRAGQDAAARSRSGRGSIAAGQSRCARVQPGRSRCRHRPQRRGWWRPRRTASRYSGRRKYRRLARRVRRRRHSSGIARSRRPVATGRKPPTL